MPPIRRTTLLVMAGLVYFWGLSTQASSLTLSSSQPELSAGRAASLQLTRLDDAGMPNTGPSMNATVVTTPPPASSLPPLGPPGRPASGSLFPAGSRL